MEKGPISGGQLGGFLIEVSQSSGNFSVASPNLP
jgi:hypothetical protein